MTVAVSTAGASPAMARWLRDRVADALGGSVGEMATLLGEARRRIHEHGRSTEEFDWRALLDGPFPNLVRHGRRDEALALLEEFLGNDSHIGP